MMKPKRRSVLAVALTATLAMLIPSFVSPAGAQPPSSLPPSLQVEVLAEGLSIPWDLAMTSDGSILFTERGGRLSLRTPAGDVQQIDADLSDLFVSGESGLLGLVLAPDFDETRRFYTCQAHVGPTIEVVGWTLSADYRSAERFADPLVAGIPLASGRHGGCRLRFGPDAQLWIATGDAAQASTPQDLTSLGGKVLRVDPATGDGSVGNPFVNATNANTRRVYTYGHRNVQGLDLRPGTKQMWSVEHGPSVDDELNLLVAGGNYGWDPGPGYNERVPMTDKVKFPEAVDAKWSTGASTLALSGGVFIKGSNWGLLNGTFAVAALKAQSLRFFSVDRSGTVVGLDLSAELNSTYGRLRTPMLATDGSLLLTTANGSNDKILRITPAAAPIGSVDRVVRRSNSVRVVGWAIDANRTRTPVRIRVTVDGEPVRTRKAKRIRNDIADEFPGFSRRHGFAITVPVPKGRHRICVEAINLGPDKRPPTQLACKNVRIRN